MTQEPNIFPYIAHLLQGAEVVWKPLGEVADFQNGFAFKSNLFRDDGEAIVRITNINGKSVDLSDVKYFSISDYSTNMSPYKINKGDILIAMSGATTGKIGFYDYEYTSYLNQRVGKFIPKTHILNNRYLYHYLLSKVEEIYIIAGGGAQPNLSSNKLMEKIQIPLPPLSVQQEIVRILDKFTQLEAELEAELDCRLQQYEYYRNKLLAFNEIRQGTKVEWKTLGEVATFRRGSFPQPYTKSEWYGGDNSMPFVQVADMKDNRFNLVSITKQRISQLAMPKSIFVPKGTILVSLQGTIGRVAITQYDSYVDRTIAIFTHIDNEIDIRYFAYQLQLIFGIKKENARGSTIKTITKEEFSAFLIPLPPLEEQQRIVAILDKFDTLVNSISEGLPKEIALRRKQYEYYREKLLSFPKE